jgi:hypothetical protein
MLPIQIKAAIITALITIAMFAYVSLTVREKGPILSNTYIFASKEQRKSMNVKTEYKLVSIIFSLLGTGFLLITINIITSEALLFYAAAAMFLSSVVYAVIDSVKHNDQK